MEEPILRRTWAEIDLDALAHNYQQARRKIGPNVKYLGVVKADAYGHGAIQVSRKLEQLGADYLAVSSLDEAKELRRAGIQAPILILGHTPPAMVPQLIEYGITQAVSALAKAEAYSAAAVECGGTLKVHIKVDTGMSRLGFLVREGHFDSRRGIHRRRLRPAGTGGGGHLHPLRRLRRGRQRQRGLYESAVRRVHPGAGRTGGSGAGPLPSATAPTAALWPAIRRCIWTWCGRASPCTAWAPMRSGWTCGR